MALSETETTKPKRKKRVLFTGFGVFLLFVLGFVALFRVNFQTVQVQGESMEPTFTSGEKVVITKAYWLVGPLRKNDIVVFKLPNMEGEAIKRVYAVGGDKVDFYNVPETWNLGKGEFVVPEGQYYLLGDNRSVSEDSRTFGAIDSNHILGKVIRVEFGMASARAAQ